MNVTVPSRDARVTGISYSSPTGQRAGAWHDGDNWPLFRKKSRGLSRYEKGKKVKTQQLGLHRPGISLTALDNLDRQ